ncbi:hypothetical protein BPAE_0155g00040 [Botrytis paeoniae]|uniref:RING-type domain-containing protein n=1 Tax=Botrytis paeoniae TaxID=278948 RepID=A0A4Z1FDV1_9HELO|nr:hypothetical protein BPAE_0155g00040 [Botrytis paeoniae]
MASNPEGSPGDVLENSRPLAASTSTRERAAPRIHELSNAESSSRTSSSPTRTTDYYPLSLIVPRARNRPSTNRTTSTSMLDGSGSERLNSTNPRARNVDRTRRPSDRLEPYTLSITRETRCTSRVSFSDNLDETPSDARTTVGANYGSRVRPMRDPNRVYTPTLYDPFPTAPGRGYPFAANPSSVYVPRRTRPFPLVTATDPPDTGRVYTPRIQTHRPRVTATSTINFRNSIPVSTRNSEQAQTTPEVSSPQVPEASSEQAQTTPEVSSPQLPEASTAVGTNECPICLSPFPAPPNAVLVHPCNHEFCLVCIQTWIQTQRQRPNARPVNCPFCRGPINRIVDRDGNIVEYQRNNIPDAITEARERLRRVLGGAVANVAYPTPRASSTMGDVDAFDELRRTLNRVGPAGNISEQVARIRERLDNADADSSRPANPLDLPNGALGWWT